MCVCVFYVLKHAMCTSELNLFRVIFCSPHGKFPEQLYTFSFVSIIVQTIHKLFIKYSPYPFFPKMVSVI